MSKLYLPIIFAAARENRNSYTEKVAHLVKKFVETAQLKTEIIDARKEIEFCHANRDIDTPEAEELRKKLTLADGYIIVSPEYNHGYPGDLKNLLDSYYDEYNRKPVGIIGVSDGAFGGARMVEQLRLVTIALGMVPIRAVVHFLLVMGQFDASGKFLEEGKYKKRFAEFLDEFIWYAQALKIAREK